MNEREFHAKLDRLFLKLEQQLEILDPEIDCSLEEGILKITLANDEQLILSRQPGMGELWLACVQGAFHFQAHPFTAVTEQAESTCWMTRQGQELNAVLEQVLFQKINRGYK